MHLFRSREDADQWAEGPAGIVILTIAEGDALAQHHWVGRQQAGSSGLGRNLHTRELT